MKLKNPDENLLNGNHTISIDPNPKASANDADSKRYAPFILGFNVAKMILILNFSRASTAPHRSLPDIPVSDPNQLDTGSDLYATVGDKVGEKPQGRSREYSIDVCTYRLLSAYSLAVKFIIIFV